MAPGLPRIGGAAAVGGMSGVAVRDHSRARVLYRLPEQRRLGAGGMPSMVATVLLALVLFLGGLLVGRATISRGTAAGPVQQIINGVGAFALLLALVGIIIGGAMWGVGSLSSNYHQAAVGKRATLYSVVGAVIVGAAAALVNWAFSLGQSA